MSKLEFNIGINTKMIRMVEEATFFTVFECFDELEKELNINRIDTELDDDDELL